MQILNIFHVLVAIAMIAFILVQRGAGATAGAAFGSGASGTVFGARGAGNFMSRTTWILATLFCAISLTMAVVVSRSMEPDTDLGVVGSVTPAAQEELVDEAVDEIVAEQLGDDATVESDLPVIDDGIGDAGGVTTQALPQVDDLPNVEESVDGLGDGTGEDSGGSDNETDG